MKRYDFIAIGGGNAGLTAAAKVAGAGHKTALIDKGAVGGLCSLNGCNPKKIFVRATEVLQEMRHATTFGVEVAEPSVNWSRVIERKESFTSPVTPQTEASLKEQGIDLLQGAPQFIARNALTLNGEEIEAGAFVIATGSYPRPLEFDGAHLAKTSDDILAVREIPKRLVIIGAGVIAFEFGQVFARLGSNVSMLVRDDRALAGEDEDLVDALVEFSKTLGIKIVTQAKVQSLTQRSAELIIEVEADGKAQAIAADFILNAAGRIPSIDTLALDKAEVEISKRGVVVNEFLRSQTNPNIFAAGDAQGRLQLSPVASYEGRIVAKNFLENDAEAANYDAIPRAIYTIPPLASVGLTETQAHKRGLDVKVVNSEMTNWKVNDIIEGGAPARAKIIMEKSSDHIVGAHIWGANAGDNINFFALAIKHKIPADEIKNMVFTYPTLASALPYLLG